MQSSLKLIDKTIKLKDSAKNLIEMVSEYLAKYHSMLNISVHPLGFYVIDLGFSTENIRLRLHIKNGDLNVQNQNLMIHNHIFEMTSLVLVGNVNNIVYEECSSSEGVSFFKYETHYINGNSKLLKVNSKLNLEIAKSEIISEGNYYSLPAGIFHESIWKKNSFSATVVRTEITQNINPIVISKVDYGSTILFNRRKPTYAKKKELIDQFLSLAKVVSSVSPKSLPN